MVWLSIILFRSPYGLLYKTMYVYNIFNFLLPSTDRSFHNHHSGAPQSHCVWLPYPPAAINTTLWMHRREAPARGIRDAPALDAGHPNTWWRSRAQAIAYIHRSTLYKKTTFLVIRGSCCRRVKSGRLCVTYTFGCTSHLDQPVATTIWSQIVWRRAHCIANSAHQNAFAKTTTIQEIVYRNYIYI